MKIKSINKITFKTNLEKSSERIKMDNQIVKGKDNIFDDLGFTPEEAANLKIRADLIKN